MTGQLISFLSPKKLQLFGFYLGKKRPDIIYIFVHGLGDSIFRRADLYRYLVGQGSAVLAFNNRGSEIISKFRQINKRYKSKIIGTAHEKFTDSRDDIKGAVAWAKKQGAKKIILLGHSTGCQKVVYYLAGPYDRKIKGAVLLSPISDLAGVLNIVDKEQFNKAMRVAKKMFDDKQANQLLANDVWPYYIDAQRFLSLYLKDSKEEIFPYSQVNKKAKTLRRVKLPLYILIADEDRFLDRPAQEIADWFLTEIQHKKSRAEVIAGAGHSFDKLEKEIAKKIKNYFKI